MFRWLFNKNPTQIFPDHYALSQESLDRSICSAALSQAEQGDLVFLLTHFPETFEQTQEMLEEFQVDFGIADQPTDWSKDVVAIRGGLSSINLSLVDVFMRGYSHSEVESKKDLDVSIIVVERHPLLSVDQLLKQKFSEIPQSTKAGYYLSFEQPVIASVVTPHMKTLMTQFGMGNHSLVTSELISRRINSKLKRYERLGTDWKSTDSSEQWFAINGEP